MTNGEKLALGAAVALWLLFRDWGDESDDDVTAKGCVSPVRTGRQGIPDAQHWAFDRTQQTQEVLDSMGWPEKVSPGVASLKNRQVAEALVAQWAVESARGKSEWNYNLGGWKAAAHVVCVILKNGTTGKRERWEAWPDVYSSILAHVQRIQKKWPAAAQALAADPSSSLWVKLLGRGGYYGENVDAYAKAWEDQLPWVRSNAAPQ